MPDIVPILMIIKKKPDGSMLYPPFRKTLAVFNNPNYSPPDINTDRTSDCKTDSPHSPLGQMLAVKLCDPAFAAQAVAAFPDLCSKMTEAELEDFWDNRAMAMVPEYKHDTEILQGLQTEKQLRIDAVMGTDEVDARIAKALDPNDPAMGVRKNDNKTWKDKKRNGNITIVED